MITNYAENHKGTWSYPFWWWLEWMIPGMGMFCEAYIVFAAGLIKNFQQALWPGCMNYGGGINNASGANGNSPSDPGCNGYIVTHFSGYIQIIGIMAGMLAWGYLADVTGRKWGSRIVMAIMWTGVVMLTFTSYAPSGPGYLNFWMTAQTWYGFGVGGEYPLASSSSIERAAKTPLLRQYRGRQNALVFSQQGMGNFVNSIVILISMKIFQQTNAVPWPNGPTGGKSGNGGIDPITGDPYYAITYGIDRNGARDVMVLQYGVGAVIITCVLLYRTLILRESRMYKEENVVEAELFGKSPAERRALYIRKHLLSAYYFWPRQIAACGAWVANDFAFYGNKLQQGVFLDILFPPNSGPSISGSSCTYYVQQKWSVLFSFISLLGYYTGAWLVDKRWYGRRRMQNVGFAVMFGCYISIWAAWKQLGAQNSSSYIGATPAGVKTFQALYYISGFFNQFGPNVTTWMVAAEIFPTNIRATYHGWAACLGKTGAIIAALWISFINTSQSTTAVKNGDPSEVFFIGAMFDIAGMFVTWMWLPDTTGLALEEYDRLQHYIMAGRMHEYHGEAINPRHLSPWERFILRWGKNYNPELDALALQQELKQIDAEAVSKVAADA